MPETVAVFLPHHKQETLPDQIVHAGIADDFAAAQQATDDHGRGLDSASKSPAVKRRPALKLPVSVSSGGTRQRAQLPDSSRASLFLACIESCHCQTGKHVWVFDLPAAMQVVDCTLNRPGRC